MNKHQKFPTFHEVGEVDVDAGLIWVGDPCYVIKDQGEKRPVSLGQSWGDFCTRLSNHEERSVTNFAHDGGHGGMGLAISTQFGDGTYPVYVEYDENNRPRRILIDFDPPEDD